MTTTYVLNKGQSVYLNTGLAEYYNSQSNVSVNPIVHTPNLVDGGFSTNWTLNFYEIRNDSGATTNSLIGDTDYLGTGASAVYNRVLPATTTAIDFVSNPEQTQSYRLKIPEGTSLVLDPTHDYFVVIYSDESGTPTYSVEDNNMKKHRRQTHIAKITDIVLEDMPDRINDGTTYGDSFNFYPSNIYTNKKDIKYMIFKGPKKTDTSVIALAYGLLGMNQYAAGGGGGINSLDYNADGLSENYTHDSKTIVSSPTFYFYKDRLNNKEQLKHSTKYRLTRGRFYTTTHKELVNSVFLTCESQGNRIAELSPYTYTVNLIDNLKIKDKDFANAWEGANEYNATHHAIMLNNYTVDHTNWDDIFRNYRRGIANRPAD